MAQKMVVIKLAAIMPHLPDAAVPLHVAAALEVRKALPDHFDLQQFTIEVYEHQEEKKLPGEGQSEQRSLN